MFDKHSEAIRKSKRLAGNGLTLDELEKIEQVARLSDKIDATIALRLAAALREALQITMNACNVCAQFHRTHSAASRSSESDVHDVRGSKNQGIHH